MPEENHLDNTVYNALALLLLHGGSWTEGEPPFQKRRAWKNIGFDSLDALRSCNLIYGNPKNKSVYLTEEGYHLAKQLKDVLEEVGPKLKSIFDDAVSPKGAYTLYMEFDFEELVCWRTIKIPSSYTFYDLHFVIQCLMSWLDYHLFDFRVSLGTRELKIVEFLPNDDPGEFEPENVEIIDVETLKLSDIFSQTEQIEYSYDYGDGWLIRIRLEDTEEELRLCNPVCIDGEGDNPPDDIGGEGGFERFLQAIGNPDDENHDFLTSWGQDQGFFRFNLQDANEYMLEWRDNKRIHTENKQRWSQESLPR